MLKVEGRTMRLTSFVVGIRKDEKDILEDDDKELLEKRA